MRHKWDDEWGWMDKIYSTCAVCGGTRVRDRFAGTDYINAPGMSVDMVGSVRKGWRYEDTPRSCPGESQDTPDALADHWPTLPDLDGIDRFANYPVTGGSQHDSDN